ncbi:MAG TPA: YraN family protein [Candidatus Omnitrophota bacterium]|nr:YraN family protein [Candidatus Omnitrophota bacterium]
MLKDKRKITGGLGEDLAEKYLRARGYSVIEKNFRTPFGEIDLIAERDGCLVFLEVKTRLSERFGPPLSAVTWEKKKRIVKNCQYYLKTRKLLWGPCRIDVMGIKLDRFLRIEVLKYVKNAIEIN